MSNVVEFNGNTFIVDINANIQLLTDEIGYKKVVSSDIIEITYPDAKWSRVPTTYDTTFSLNFGAHLLVGIDEKNVYLHIRPHDKIIATSSSYEMNMAYATYVKTKEQAVAILECMLKHVSIIKKELFSYQTYVDAILSEYINYDCSAHPNELESILSAFEPIKLKIEG